MNQKLIGEEVNQLLLVTVTDTKKAPELQPISLNDQESKSASNISKWSLIFKLSLAITSIGIFLVFLSLTIWITPTPPTIHVHSMHISFADRNLPIWSATFSIKNPNEKLYIKYAYPSVWVFHRRRLVWRVRFGSFGQKSQEENEVVVKGDVTGVINVAAAREMEKEMVVMGKLEGLDMVFMGRVGFYPGTSTFWGEQNMTAFCENVRAKLSTNDDDIIYGTKRSSERDCRVRLPRFP